MTVALTALEFLVAFLQAYVFAVLTCMYLNDALHPGPLRTQIAGVCAPVKHRNEIRSKGVQQWKRKQQSTSAPASLASAWVARASASATSSAATWRARCATRRPPTASSAA